MVNEAPSDKDTLRLLEERLASALDSALDGAQNLQNKILERLEVIHSETLATIDARHDSEAGQIEDVSLKSNRLDSRLNAVDQQLALNNDVLTSLLPKISRLLLQYPLVVQADVERLQPKNDLINLNDYKSNGRFSQGGEEGIVAKLLEYINPVGFVIEFGAADGVFCSNTAQLWSQGIEALLIESDPECFEALKSNTKGYPNVVAKQAVVENIDDHTTRIADIVSIDIDGYDFFIAEKMQTKHQIVIIEYNPTVPPHVEMIPSRPSQGASAKSIVSMMMDKGYSLVACTKTNLFFLLGDHSDKFETRLDVLFDYSSLNYVVTTFDGLYEMIGEWDYGLEEPADLALQGRDLESSKFFDRRTNLDLP